MNGEQIIESEEFQRCAQFHGHICPGLSIGYRLVNAAMAALQEIRSEDEELVAVVETDACSADAVQVLTGCTFGKGNLIFKDFGKMALTLLSRNSGKGVRVFMLPGSLSSDQMHQELRKKVMEGYATEEEQNRFKEMHLKQSHRILEKPADEFLSIREVEMKIPAKARIEPSFPCAECSEATMRSKLETIDGRSICRGCIEKRRNDR